MSNLIGEQAHTHSALVRLYNEFAKVEPMAQFSGTFARKGGYHNLEYNHVHGILGGSRNDYSIRLSMDREGPNRLASAIDISFKDAREDSDFETIAKYSNRLYVAMKNNDPRLYYKGKRVVREFFGNIDLDRAVEGWTLCSSDGCHSRAATSDISHLWHIHISFQRWVWGLGATVWDAINGILDILLGRSLEKEEDMPLDANDKRWIQAELAKLPNNIWEHRLPVKSAANLAGWPDDFTAPARGYLVGKDAAQTAILRNQAAMMKAINAVAVKVDALDEQLGQELRKAIEGAQFVADIDVIQEQ